MLEDAVYYGMTPSQFWDSTMDEFRTYARAFNRRIEIQHDLLAWLAVYNMAPHVKRPPTVDQLRGRTSNKIEHKRPETAAEFFAPMKARKRELEAQEAEKNESPFQKLIRLGNMEEGFPFTALLNRNRDSD